MVSTVKKDPHSFRIKPWCHSQTGWEDNPSKEGTLLLGQRDAYCKIKING